MPRPAAVLHELLAALRSYIRRSFLPGEELPGERTLCRTFGVSQSTLHRAMRLLADEKLVAAMPRAGWARPPEARPAEAKKNIRIGIITRRVPEEWRRYPLYSALQNEAQQLGLTLVPTPASRPHRQTAERNRPDLTRVPWAEFDVALIVDVDDSESLSHPSLRSHAVIAVDQDARSFGLPSVSFDNQLAGRLAARRLFSAGHRSFVILQEFNAPGWIGDPAWLERIYGFESELARLGAYAYAEWRIEYPRFRRGFDFQGHVKDFAAKWLSSARAARPSAVFSPSGAALSKFDELLRSARMKLPGDLEPMAVSTVEDSKGANGSKYILFSTVQLASRALKFAVDYNTDGPSAEPPIQYIAPYL